MPPSGDHGILIPEGSDRVTVKNCIMEVLGVGGEGIFVLSNDNNILDNEILTNWDGIFLLFSSGNTISGNDITGSGLGAFGGGNFSFCIFDIEGSDNNYTSNTISTCDFGIVIQDTDDTDIKKNTFSGHITSSISLFCVTDNIKIDSNLVMGPGIGAQGGCNVPFATPGSIGGDNVQFTNNTLDGSTGSGFGVFSGIAVNSGHTNMKISKNKISNYTSNGIYFDVEMKNMEITDNRIENVIFGISNSSGFTTSGFGHKIKNNTIKNASGAAIQMLGDEDVKIESNKISNSGAILVAKANKTTVKNNKIKNGVQSTATSVATGNGCFYKMVIEVNQDAGIVIFGSTNAVVKDNDIDKVLGEGIRVLPLKRTKVNVPPEFLNADEPLNFPPIPGEFGCFWDPRFYEVPPYLDVNDIQVLTSDKVKIENNKIKKPGLEGIKLIETTGAKVEKNKIEKCGGEGIVEVDSSKNKIKKNDIKKCPK